MKEHDPVQHPAHYTWHNNIECIDVAELMGFNLGNALKYIWRAQYHGTFVEDLRKAQWYLEREINRNTVAEAARKDWIDRDLSNHPVVTGLA